MERNLNILISEQLRRLLERESEGRLNMDKISFWCFFTAGILPIICAGISKSKKITITKIRGKWLAIQTGFRERANSAQQNSWESFIWFSASLTLALIFSLDNIDFVNLMSMLYIFLRVLYVFFTFLVFQT